jgi:hypothetical protein
MVILRLSLQLSGPGYVVPALMERKRAIAGEDGIARTVSTAFWPRLCCTGSDGAEASYSWRKWYCSDCLYSFLAQVTCIVPALMEQKRAIAGEDGIARTVSTAFWPRLRCTGSDGAEASYSWRKWYCSDCLYSFLAQVTCIVLARMEQKRAIAGEDGNSRTVSTAFWPRLRCTGSDGAEASYIWRRWYCSDCLYSFLAQVTLYRL